MMSAYYYLKIKLVLLLDIMFNVFLYLIPGSAVIVDVEGVVPPSVWAVMMKQKGKE